MKCQISGEVDWTQKSYSISSGIHSLKWRYVKDSSGSSGDDCGWVDFVQWTGASPVPDSDNWQQLDFKYDVYNRRSEKFIDGYATRYLYDGDHVIAEYDGNNNLLRKYVYGHGIDQPVSMIEVADSNAAYYYHYDALGSVIALSDSSGDTVQTYEYSVFGEPAVEDANHINPYMFAGRRYDIEIGLYYNRARYYNPYTGRFLQTDPIGYGAGINWYTYCGNNPLKYTDPSGNRPLGSHEIPVWIPRVTVGDFFSSDEYLAQNPEHSHKKDVDAYLRESGFYNVAEGATLKSVERRGFGYYCIFDVADDSGINISMATAGTRTPVLGVTDSEGETHELVDKRLVQIIANTKGTTLPDDWFSENPDWTLEMAWDVIKELNSQIAGGVGTLAGGLSAGAQGAAMLESEAGIWTRFCDNYGEDMISQVTDPNTTKLKNSIESWSD